MTAARQFVQYLWATMPWEPPACLPAWQLHFGFDCALSAMPHCRVDKYHAQYVAALQKLFEDNRHKHAKVGSSSSAAVYSTLHRGGAWGCNLPPWHGSMPTALLLSCVAPALPQSSSSAGDMLPASFLCAACLQGEADLRLAE